MPVGNFSIKTFIPELQASLVKFITDRYGESHGFSKMAKEVRPQHEQKIHLMGKTYKRYVAADIPQRSKVGYIKDSKFTDDYITAPEYGRGFTINVDDLMLNPEMPVNFNTNLKKGRSATLSERVKVASQMCIEEIRRGEDMQMKNIIETCTVELENYPVIDYGRDADLSTTITTSNLKWTIANKSTMNSFQNLDDWGEILVSRGNCGGNELIALVGTDAYVAHVNSDVYKADSDIRRNFKLTRREVEPLKGNINIPEGAMYRETINLTKSGVCHIFTYDQNFMLNDGSDTLTNWLDKDMVCLIASGNIIERQPLFIPNMLELMPMTPETKALMRQVPNSSSWLIYPDWKNCDMFTFAMAIKKQFITTPLTPNKMFTAITNS
jgi:hypothetical protein